MKPQALKLVEHLNSGGHVTRETALSEFGVQNCTARMSELTAIGFDIVKTPFKVLRGGRTMRVSSWKLRDPITPGCHVKVIKDIGTYVALKGRIGVVQTINLNHALATIFIDGLGYRSIRFNALKKLPHLPAGTRVQIKPAPYVILDYHPGVNSYTLTSANPEHTIVVHANLVEARA